MSASRPRIAVLGLGNIGIEIAHALATHEVDVVAVDLADARRDEWAARGFGAAVAGLDAVDPTSLDAVFVIVRLPEQAHAALASLPALDGEDSRPAFVITTLRSDDAAELPDHATPGWRAVECPVSGGAARARAGDLTVMVAGDVVDDDVALLERTIASRVFRFDRLGQPSVAKLLNNLLAGYHVAAFQAMCDLGGDVGLTPAVLRDLFSASSAQSWMVANLDVVLMDLLVKDVALAVEQFDWLPTVQPDPSAVLEAAWVELQRAASNRSTP